MHFLGVTENSDGRSAINILKIANYTWGLSVVIYNNTMATMATQNNRFIFSNNRSVVDLFSAAKFYF